jgi:hypothetical protein
MCDSIQSTLFNKHDKDSWKPVSYLEKELENIETLMSYDKRPVALANYDKRKKQLITLIQTKKIVEGNTSSLLKKSESKKSLKKVANKKTENSLYKNKNSLLNKKLHEDNGMIDIKFFGLIDINNIGRKK